MTGETDRLATLIAQAETEGKWLTTRAFSGSFLVVVSPEELKRALARGSFAREDWSLCAPPKGAN